MQKALIRYTILLKENLMRKATWISVIAMLCLLAVVAQIRIPTAKNSKVGIYTEDSDKENAIIKDLYAQKGAFEYKCYGHVNQLYEDIRSGELECGFVLSAQLKDQLETGNTDKCVKYISSPYSTKGEVAKETFFASFLRIYSEQILQKSEQDIFTESDSARMESMLKANEQFMQSDFFQLEQVAVDADVTVPNEGTCYPLQGLFGIFLLGFMYFANGRKFEQSGKWIKHYLTRRGVIGLSMLQTLAAVTLPVVAGMVVILQFTGGCSMPEAVCRVLLLVLIGVPWIVLYSGLARSQESFIAYGILLMVMEILLYPVIWDITRYVPALKVFRYMTPLGFLF